MYLGYSSKPNLQLCVYSFRPSSPDGDIGGKSLAYLSSHPLVALAIGSHADLNSWRMVLEARPFFLEISGRAAAKYDRYLKDSPRESESLSGVILFS